MFLVLIPIVLQLQSAPAATFEVDLWPNEGRPVFEATAQRLELHEFPSKSSKVVQIMTARPKQQLMFDDTLYRTIRPGRLRVLASTAVTGRRLGDIRRLARSDYYSGKFGSANVPVEAGESIEYLQYRAEGTCFVRIASMTIDADPCPAEREDEFRLEVEPTTEWWIRIVADGKARGWLLVTDATARVVERLG